MLREKKTDTTSSSGPPYEIVVSHDLGVVPDFVFLTSKGPSTVWLEAVDYKKIVIASNDPRIDFDLHVIKDHSIFK